MSRKVRDIIVLTGISIVLACSLVLLSLLLFTDVFFGNNNKIVYNGSSDDGQYETVDDSEVSELRVSYNGGELFAGGSLIKDSFTVEIIKKDGTVSRVNNYTCDMLNDAYRLKEGSNTLIFYYGKKHAAITLEAVNVRSRYIHAPTYVLYGNGSSSEDKLKNIENGKLTYKEALYNVAFTGDSQIEALETYRILDSNTVEALVGASADYLEQNFSTVVTKAYGKDALIVHYGINSLSASEEERTRRIEQYRELLVKLKEELPGTRVIVSGVFPVSSTIYYNKASFAYIDSYNFDLLEMCMEEEVEFYSNSEYMVSHQELFCADGLHLEYEFYADYWLKDLIEVMGL